MGTVLRQRVENARKGGHDYEAYRKTKEQVEKAETKEEKKSLHYAVVFLQKSMPQLVKNMRKGYTFYQLSSETGSSSEKDAQVKISDGMVPNL